PPSPPSIPTLSLHDALPIYEDRVHFHHHLFRRAHGHFHLLAPPRRFSRCHRFVDHQVQTARLQTWRVVLRKEERFPDVRLHRAEDRKSTRLNSSHVSISYAV